MSSVVIALFGVAVLRHFEINMPYIVCLVIGIFAGALDISRIISYCRR